MKKVIVTLLAAVLTGVTIFGGFTGSTKKVNAASVKGITLKSKSEKQTGKKPELNVLIYNLPYDLNEDPILPLQQKLSGYKVKYHYLPAENASEKLMMEIAGGAKYDMILRVTPTDYGQLVGKNALMDISTLLDKHGENIKDLISDYAWKVMQGNEKEIYAIPLEWYTPNYEENKNVALFEDGLGFRSDALKDIGYEPPKTLEDFDAVLKAYKDKTGNAGLTLTKDQLWQGAIMSAFGMSNNSWYDIDGTLQYKLHHPQVLDYITYMQKLYKDGLLDNDMPINAMQNLQEKFTTNKALCMFMHISTVAEVNDALKANNPNAKVVFSSAMSKTASEKPIATVRKGFEGMMVIPKSSPHPEDAIKWYNALSTKEKFKEMFVGEEGKSFKIENGQYYPIFPDFKIHQNADKLVAAFDKAEKFKMWQARARKTPEMAEAYDQMNQISSNCKIVLNLETFAANLPELQNMSSLEGAVRDELLQGIVDGTSPKTILKQLLKIWDEQGGKECEKAMQKWYSENKELIK